MSELENLKQQMSRDFELTWRMMNDQSQRLDGRINALEGHFHNMGGTLRAVQKAVEALQGEMGQAQAGIRQFGIELQDGNRQFLGRLRLQEERFRAIIDAVEGQLQGAPTRGEFDALKARVEALEEERPGAA